MTINPINWIKWICNLITRISSIHIQEQRLALAQEQISALTRENLDLKSKIAILETEKSNLQIENQKLKLEAENRKKMSQFRPTAIDMKLDRPIL